MQECSRNMRCLRSSKSGAMDINDILPEELILQIVARLPVKSVGRCRSVSKKWRSLFSDPQFAKLHLQLSPKHKSVIFRLKRELKTLDFDLSNAASFEKESRVLEAPFHHGHISLRFLGSCNGLVAARDFSHFSDFAGKQEGLFIWNPATGFFKKLPSRRFPARPGEFGDDDIMVGFGCASSNNEYKLLMGAEIFSSKTNSWKPIKIPPGNMMRMSLGVLCRGALHWPAYPDDRQGHYLYAFDLEKEEFSMMKLPRAIQTQSDSIWCDFGVTCEGCLFVLAKSLEQDFSCVVEFWVMRVYGNGDSWTKSLCVKIPTHPDRSVAVEAISVMETSAFVRNRYPVQVENIMSTTYNRNEEQNTGIYMIQSGLCPMVVYEEGLYCLA